MQYEDMVSLSKRRLELAADCLGAAQDLLAAGRISSVPNRAYYAAFHAMRAVLAFDGKDQKRHSGLISEFRRLYIKTGIFQRELSEIISVLSDSRTGGDYNDFYIISKQEAAVNLRSAEHFVCTIEAYLEAEKYALPQDPSGAPQTDADAIRQAAAQLIANVDAEPELGS